MQHSSSGEDIWNGNSCILATECGLLMEKCEVTSSTGRGVVGKGFAKLELSDCRVNNSAATGIYIGKNIDPPYY